MLSYFPARDVEEPATEAFVTAKLAEVRTDIAGLRAELHTEIGGLRAELHTEIGILRTELHTEIGILRTELHTEVADLRAEVAGVEQRLMRFVHEEIRASMQWTIGAMVSLVALLIAALALFR